MTRRIAKTHAVTRDRRCDEDEARLRNEVANDALTERSFAATATSYANATTNYSPTVTSSERTATNAAPTVTSLEKTDANATRTVTSFLKTATHFMRLSERTR